MSVEINIREGFARARTTGLRPLLRSVAMGTLRSQSVTGKILSILITNDEEMRTLNHQWRGLDRTTDVLSFESDDEFLGDVVISLGKAERQAERFGVTRDEEISRLLVHGVLHLLGHDHRNTAERKTMNALTEKIMNEVI